MAAGRHVPAHALAHVFYALEEYDRALDYLEKAFEERSFLIGFLAVDGIWDRLRGMPRFESLMRRAGLPLSAPPPR